MSFSSLRYVVFVVVVVVAVFVVVAVVVVDFAAFDFKTSKRQNGRPR